MLGYGTSAGLAFRGVDGRAPGRADVADSQKDEQSCQDGEEEPIVERGPPESGDGAEQADGNQSQAEKNGRARGTPSPVERMNAAEPVTGVVSVVLDLVPFIKPVGVIGSFIPHGGIPSLSTPESLARGNESHAEARRSGDGRSRGALRSARVSSRATPESLASDAEFVC